MSHQAKNLNLGVGMFSMSVFLLKLDTSGAQAATTDALLNKLIDKSEVFP